MHCVLASRGENQHRACSKSHGNRKSSRALGSLGRRPGPAIYHSIPPFQTSQTLPGRAQGHTFGRREHSLRGRPEGGNEAGLGCGSVASQESPWPRPCSDRLTSWSSDPVGLAGWQEGRGAAAKTWGKGEFQPALASPQQLWRARSPQPARHNSDKGLSGAAGGAREGSQPAASTISRQPHLTSPPRGPRSWGNMSLWKGRFREEAI